MRILVFEPMKNGHHTNYLAALAARAAAGPAGLPGEVVLAVTRSHRAAPGWAERLRSQEHAVTVQELDRELPHEPALALRRLGGYGGAMRAYAGAFLDAVARADPERIVITSADFLTLAAVLAAPRAVARALEGRHATAILHQGYAPPFPSRAAALKGRVYAAIRARAPWQRRMHVNPLIGGAEPGTELCPDPVAPLPRVPRAEACARLGLDPSDRHVAFVGRMTGKVALPELVRALLAADLGPGVKLLLAGEIRDAAHRSFLAESPEARALGPRLVRIDRRLSETELAEAYAAADILAPLYRQSQALSANLLKAVSAGKPALVADAGYGGWLAARFPVGRAVPLSDAAAAGAALRELLAGGHDPEAPALARLMAFHAPKNFAACLLGPRPDTPPPTRWPEAEPAPIVAPTR